MAPLLLRDSGVCQTEEVNVSIRKCQVQLLPLVVYAFHQWGQGGQFQSQCHSYLLDLFLSIGYLKTVSVSDERRVRNVLLKMLMPYKMQKGCGNIPD